MIALSFIWVLSRERKPVFASLCIARLERTGRWIVVFALCFLGCNQLLLFFCFVSYVQSWNFNQAVIMRLIFSSPTFASIEVYRKVQGVPQTPAAANLWHQEKEKKDTNWRMQNKQTNARESHRPALSSPSEVITMLNRTENTGMTQHETPRSKPHKARQTKNHTRTTALEWPVA